uniref:FAD-binding PCMH-type domain-containing protein n=1 Tax=Fagus sylvatica TaxID=28930 RepID=A0A2N9IJN2_FAGSY
MGKSSQLHYLSRLPLLFLLLLQVSTTWAASNSVYETFVQCLSDQTKQPDLISKIVYAQNNPSYTSVLQAYIRNARFNTSSTPKPVIIVTPTNESHVPAAVVCSKKNGLQIRIRSGGHDYAGISYVSDVPFIILDMFNLRSITVDMNEQTAWVQTGATLGELYYSIWKKSKVHAFPAGVCPTVGVGGHVSGAGYGNMLRKYGLTTDNVVDARIVDKTISVFRAERTLEENATDIVYRGRRLLKPTIIAEFLGKADDVVALLGKEFPELGLKKEDVKEMSWIDSVLWWNQNNGTPEFLLDRNPNSANYVRRKSDYVQTPIPKARLELWWVQMRVGWGIVGLQLLEG